MRNGHGTERLIGTSAAMDELREEIARVARSDAKVLITGESGVGKELVAAAVHAQSPRAQRAVRRRQLRGHPRNAARVRAVRTREGQFHRRLSRQARQARNGRGRDDLSRRNRRDDAPDAGSAAAIPRDRRCPESRRAPQRRPRRRARHCRHQQEPARPHLRGAVPRRPVLPAERHPHQCAAAARSPRGYSHPHRLLSQPVHRVQRTASFPRSRRKRWKR